MKTVKIHEGNVVTVLIVGSVALLAVLAGAGSFLVSARFAGSTIAGGLLALANFYWMKTALVRSLRLDSRQAPRFAFIRYLARLTVLATAILFLIRFCDADIFGLLLGLSVLVLNIVALSFFMISAKGD